MQKWVVDNYFLMYLAYDECKSVVAETFIRNFNGKTYKRLQLIIVNLLLIIWMN